MNEQHRIDMNQLYNIHQADNVRLFSHKLDQRLSLHTSGCLAVMNVRQFKFINEIFGREFADRLLKDTKKSIQSLLSKTEFCCLDHADLFYIFLEESQPQKAKQRMENMMNHISSQFVISGDSRYQILFYAGIVMCSEKISGSDLRAHKLMTSSHFALASAKDLAPNQAWVYDAELHKKEELEYYVESRMHRALKDHEFQMFLQPKIDLKTQSTAGAEALVRWKPSKGRMLFPNDFIPLFERNGFCAQLDRYMIRQACRLLRQWIDDGKQVLPISVNQSKTTIFQAGYGNNLRKLLREYRISPGLITLEILEDAALYGADTLSELIHELKTLGVRISMDDFGTGYSSLTLLGNLPIDELKLDREFLWKASENPRSRIIIEHILQLAKRLELSTVAEGIETPEQAEMVQIMGGDYGQGYLYSKPIPSEEFTTQYAEQNHHTPCF